MHSTLIRQKFLEFFHRKGHEVIASSPLLPQDDPTLLFVNAGMVPFKDVFTGQEKRFYTRATSSQKCVRAGGKHNDLENVGRTARHHTFFEMLGNFSFGDYFKKEACAYAWEFLTQELHMDPKKLFITVFGGEGTLPPDTEAEEIWKQIGVPSHQISRKGAADNFWSMGDTGPCGPCTEIHYDRGEGEDEGDRRMEFWNLVFMQYERKADGTLVPLPAPSVDTGMGLERVTTILNGLQSNYDTDLLKSLVDFCARQSGKNYQASDLEDDVSMRVIADHSRATTFLIADGVLPSNDGRGYVLRRIMRRAIRHGARLGFKQAFFQEVCAQVVAQYQSIYPELNQAKALIQKVVLQEEESFRRTLGRGLELFHQAIKSLKPGDSLDGAVVFKLYETYGFPADLTEILAEEKKLNLDWVSFEKAKKAHEAASAGDLGLKGIDDRYKQWADQFGMSEFDDVPELGVQVLAVHGNEILLEKTPFYAESGGQIGDTGTLENKDAYIRVLDTKKIAGLSIHRVQVLSGSVSEGDFLKARVDTERRDQIRRHHSATHLLHAALRQKFGDHLTQKGSWVSFEKLRFDFSHFEAIAPADLLEVERQVNAWILENKMARSEIMPLEEAKQKGAMALFGEKYAQKVRVVELGSHSIELCGGTHVARTGDMGSFRIISEGPLAAGVRRIEAVVGQAAVSMGQSEHESLSQIAKMLGSSVTQTVEKLSALQAELKELKKKLEQAQDRDSSQRAAQLVSKIRDCHGISLIAEKLENIEVKQLQHFADELRNQMKSGIVVLGLQSSAQKCSLLVAITPDLVGRYHAGHLVGKLAEKIGGKGGGRPDFAQAGGTQPENLSEALENAQALILGQ
ncbi:MAG: alanine--tRNA ligase [Myxococcaceae bacterium]|nr:alanine--tRNA ligase [Myxococcaceae bacterium]MBH2006637.1 alanine--tRNA ligase [Myxococcaceae bacterium]